MSVSADVLTQPTPALPAPRQTVLRQYLSEAHLKELEQYCRPTDRRAGATLFRQGEPAETFSLVVQGSVELRARPPGRRVYRTVEVIRPACSVGEEALFGAGTYLTSARILEDTELLTLSRAAFRRLSTTHPAVSASLLQYAGGCLLRTLRRAAILTQAPAEVSLRLLLGELASSSEQRTGGVVPLRITHAQLAGVLHLSRETVSRLLGQLADEGVVQVARGVIRLCQD